VGAIIVHGCGHCLVGTADGKRCHLSPPECDSVPATFEKEALHMLDIPPGSVRSVMYMSKKTVDAQPGESIEAKLKALYQAKCSELK